MFDQVISPFQGLKPFIFFFPGASLGRSPAACSFALPPAFVCRPFGAGEFYLLPAEIMLTNRRYAPGTPAGSWRKKASAVKTYVPLP